MKKPVEKIFLASWRPYLWLALFVFVVFGWSLTADFTYFDDTAIILDHFPFFQNPANVIKAFQSDVSLQNHSGYYRPLNTLTFLLDVQLGGKSPFVFHLSSLFYHWLASSLFFAFLVKSGADRRRSFLLAGFFATAPILTAGVAWIPGRIESLFAAFSLLSLLFLIRYARERRFADLGVCGLATLAAFFTKESAVALLPVQFLVWTLIEKRSLRSRDSWLLAGSSIAAAAIWAAARAAANVGAAVPAIADPVLALAVRWPIAMLSTLGKIIIPVHLTVMACYRDLPYWWGIVAAAAIAVALWLSPNRRWPRLLTGGVWFALFCLLPCFNLGNLDLETRAYLPFAGLGLVLLEIEPPRRFARAAPAAFVLLIVGYAMVTVNYERYFRDAQVFGRRAVSDSPHCALANTRAGIAATMRNDFSGAEPYFLRAAELEPRWAQAYGNLATLAVQQKRPDRVEQYALATLKLDPKSANSYFLLGLVRLHEGRKDEAAAMWRKCLEIDPQHAGARRYFSDYERTKYPVILSKDLPVAR